MWLLILGVLVGQQSFAAQNPCKKLTPFVQKTLHISCAPTQTFTVDDDVRTANIFVVLAEQADLSMQSMYESSALKRQYIVSALQAVAANTQAPIIELLKEKKVTFTPYYIHNMIRIENASAELVFELITRVDVAKVFGNPSFQLLSMGRRNLSGQPDGSDEPAPNGIEQNIVSTGADRVWNQLGVKGKGITVAGQDTGVQWDHPALTKQYRGSQSAEVNHNYNWFDSITSGGNNKCGFSTQAPCDDDQHGTHTMGTILGDDGGANKVGMAPEANWIACRNMNAGNGTPGSYIDCFQFFLAPFPLGGDPMKDGNPSLAPNVMNNSWGCPTSEGCKGNEMVEILKVLKDAGIFVVASAGNDGPGCSTIADQPAQISDTTFSVGAHNHRNGLIAGFSSRGPSRFDGKPGPDITAPGVGIRSSIPGGGFEGGFWSGTSMAGPHVVGLVALIWSANPKLIGQVDETAELIRQTATPTVAADSCGGIPGTTIPNNTFGYGRIDAYKAVNRALGL
jgi:serine protease AprX